MDGKHFQREEGERLSVRGREREVQRGTASEKETASERARGREGDTE